MCDQPYKLANVFVSVLFVVKFRACEHDMPCASEISGNGGNKQAHVESCISATHITSPLSQSLWPRNLTWWWHERLPSIKSHNPLVTWSWEFTKQIKNILPLPQCRWPPNLAGWWHTMRSSHTECHMIFPSRGLMRSYNK